MFRTKNDPTRIHGAVAVVALLLVAITRFLYEALQPRRVRDRASKSVDSAAGRSAVGGCRFPVCGGCHRLCRGAGGSPRAWRYRSDRRCRRRCRFDRGSTRPITLASVGTPRTLPSTDVSETLRAAGYRRVPIYCPVTSTMRKRALPCIMRAYASAACSRGKVSIMGRIFSRTLKASVSSLSIGVPVSVP